MANKTPEEVQAEEAKKAAEETAKRQEAQRKEQEQAIEGEVQAAQEQLGTPSLAPGQPPRGNQPADPATKLAGMSGQEIVSSGTPEPRDNVLLAALAMNVPAEVEKPTYDQNRWKVGEGHSMLDQWVQGEEVDLDVLLGRLGRNDAEKVAALNRLLRMGAITRMADQEPAGGSPSGPLAPLTSPNRRVDTQESIKMLMGQDIQERVAGQATPQEIQDAKGRNNFAVASSQTQR
jgi:hypothetical protein